MNRNLLSLAHPSTKSFQISVIDMTGWETSVVMVINSTLHLVSTEIQQY